MCQRRIDVDDDEYVCCSGYSSQRYTACKWTEGPAESIEEIVPNPKPVPAEVEQEGDFAICELIDAEDQARLSWEETREIKAVRLEA